jgi:hypothetical protein
MNTTETTELTDLLNRVNDWPSAQRITVARLILGTIETHGISPPPGKGSLKDLLGILKTAALPPNHGEYRAILEEELIKKHLK